MFFPRYRNFAICICFQIMPLVNLSTRVPITPTMFTMNTTIMIIIETILAITMTTQTITMTTQTTIMNTQTATTWIITMTTVTTTITTLTSTTLLGRVSGWSAVKGPSAGDPPLLG